jgi:hypothetical protein
LGEPDRRGKAKQEICVMGDSPNNHGEWQQETPAEPPADLLRRALSHVEDLLGRLEYPAVTRGEIGSLPDDAELADSDDPAEVVEPAGNGRATPHRSEAVTQQLPPSSVERADAMRERLTAQAQHHRHADGSRAPGEAAAQGEAILAEARDLAQMVEAEARETADSILADAHRSADAAVAGARVQAERILAAARAEAAGLREQGRAEGADLTQQAAYEAEQTLADAHAAAAALLTSARTEADELRLAAQERAGQAGAGAPAHTASHAASLDAEVAAAVAAAVVAADEAAAAPHRDADELLKSAEELIEHLRDALRAILGPEAPSLAALETSAGKVTGLRAQNPAAPPPGPSRSVDGEGTAGAATESTSGQVHEHRGPLGQLFGATRH